MQNQILGFFILTTVALGILASVQWNSSRRLGAQAEARQAAMDAMNVNLAGQRDRIATLETEGQNLHAVIGQLKRDNTSLRVATNELQIRLTRVQRAGEGDEGTAAPGGLEDDALGAWYRQLQERLLDDLYGELVASWNLEPETARKLRSALMDLQRRTMLAGGPEPAAGTDPGAGTGAGSRSAADIESAIKALLSAEQYGDFQAYSRTLADRLWLRPLRGELEASGHPFTEQQFLRLVQVRSDARQHLPPWPDDPSDAAAMKEAMETRQATLRKRVLSEAPNFLDPPQVEALTRHMEGPGGGGA